MIAQDYRSLMQRVHPYPLPCADFNPLSAPNRKLAEYGLLEKPNERLEPQRYAFWQEMFGGKINLVRPQFPEELTRELRELLLTCPTKSPSPRAAFDHTEDSQNWSGAYITPMPRPNRFVHVIGGWTVPRPAVPEVLPEGADASNQEYHSSTWIGIGGHRSYNTLPQIGTSQSVKVVGGVNRIEYSAWWQWWNKADPFSHVPQVIPDFEVAAGDGILASLSVEAPSPGDVHFIIMNLRTRMLVPFKVRAPSGILPLGSTAEWIHERPARPGSQYRYPLPHCTEVVFRYCLAWNAPDFGTPTELQVLQRNVRLIRMCEAFPTPHRSALVSRPSRTSPTDLHIVYREAR